MVKKLISLKLPTELFEQIEKIQTSTKKTRNDIIVSWLSSVGNLKNALGFLFQLFQRNHDNLEVTEEELYEVRKILEMLQKND